MDATGAAYQEIVGPNLRGDRGQYFTPRRAVDLAVRILNPGPDAKVLDPACGTGGFLVATLAHQLRRFRSEYQGEDAGRTERSVYARLRSYAQEKLFGADFDPFLVRACIVNVLMAANTEARILHLDSLTFPRCQLPDNEAAKVRIPFGSVDVLMTNPPFGSGILVSDRAILEDNALARRWTRTKEGQWLEQNAAHNVVVPEILFIAQAVRWLRPGGRIGIVPPNGVLSNPGDEYIRRWIFRYCWVLACVEVPVEAFIAEANIGVLTSLLFLKKKTKEELDTEARRVEPGYPIFMAVAETAGVDRRGNPLYKRNPDGSQKFYRRLVTETVTLRGGRVVTLQRELVNRELDDDFPAIGDAYEEFRTQTEEPGE